MKYIHKMLIISILCFCSDATAKPSISVGLGPQYAGFIGAQLAQITDRHKFRFSLGLLGVSAGYEYLISTRISFGCSVFRYHDIVDDLSGFAVSANYYFTSLDQKGFMLGLDLLDQKPRDSTRNPNHEGLKVLISTGYRF